MNFPGVKPEYIRSLCQSVQNALLSYDSTDFIGLQFLLTRVVPLEHSAGLLVRQGLRLLIYYSSVELDCYESTVLADL